MKNKLVKMLIFLMFTVLLISGCEEINESIWHPPEIEEENTATVIVKLNGSGFGLKGCYNIVLRSDGKEYEFKPGYLSSGSYYYYSSYFSKNTETEIKVPAGTYYLTAIAFNSSNKIIRSNNFSVAEKATKIIYYSIISDDDGEFLIE